MTFDLLVDNAIIVTMEPGCEPFRGWIGVNMGRIAACEAGKAPACEAVETIDAYERILMPGLINGHCHGDMTIFRGMGDGFTLHEQDEVFSDTWWFGKYLTNEDLFCSRQLTYLEAISSGTTFMLDNMYWSIGLEAVFAMKETGIRGGLAEVYFNARNFDPAGGSQSDSYLSEFASVCRKTGLIPILSGIEEECFSKDNLLAVCAAAERNGMPVTQHVAESQWRMNQIRERFALTPIQYMERIGVLGRTPLIASHAVYVDQADRDILQRYGVQVVNTPVCEMKIADGVAPVTEYIAEGSHIGLGTDGAMWNNTNDMFGEIKCTVLLQSLAKGVRSVSARQALEMATIRGAQVFGVGTDIGSISTGKWADFILIDATGIHMQPLQLGKYENILSCLAFCTCGRDVTDTFIGGQSIMRDRKITTMNVQPVISAVVSARERILAAYDQKNGLEREQ